MQSNRKTLDHLAGLYLSAPHSFAPGHPRSRRNGHGLHHANDRLRLADLESAVDMSLSDTLTEALQGAARLEIGCPQEPMVQMYLDATGRIHLWRGRVDSNAHAAIISLIKARFWVRENIRLIALTQPDSRFSLDAEPMLHVLTDNVSKATSLNGSLGPYLKMHLVRTRPTAA